MDTRVAREVTAIAAATGISIPQPLRGKTAVITGASDGIGRVAAERLAAAGAHVVMVGRNAAKTEAAAHSIMNANGRRNVSWEIADLKETRSVIGLADALRARHPKIHMLVNNAGAIFRNRALNSDGLERTFALNHLAYFTLTLLLLDCLYAASTPGDPSRIIVVSSQAHTRASLDLNDLQSQQRFRSWRTYSNSKLENLLFVRALNARLDTSRVVVHALHPGVVATRFATSGNGRWGRAMRWLMNLRSVSPTEGADTLVWVATNSGVTRHSGGYYIKRIERIPSTFASSDTIAEQLWVKSSQLAGIDADALAARARDVVSPRVPD